MTRTDRPTPTSCWVLLAAALAVRAALELWFYRASLGFPVVFGDGVFATLTAFQWSLAPGHWPHHQLLPLPYCIQGLLLLLWPDPVLGPTLLQSTVSGLTLLCLWLAARELFPDEPHAAAAALALAALHPAAALLASGQLQIPYLSLSVSAGTMLCLRHLRTGGNRPLCAAALAFAAAAMTHYDGWLYASLFSAFLAWRTRAARLSLGTAAGTLALTWAPAALWLFEHRTSFLAHVSQEQDVRLLLPALRRWLGPLEEFSALFPAVAAAAALSLWRLAPRRRAAAAWYAFFPLGELLLLIPLYVIRVVTPYCHYTHTWTNRQLLVPLAAGCIRFLPARFKTPACALLILALGAWSASSLPGLSRGLRNFSPEIIKTAALLRGLWRGAALADSDRVLVEVFRDNREFEGRIWEIPLLFLIRPPRVTPYERDMSPPLESDRVVTDRPWRYVWRNGRAALAETAPSLWGLPPRELADRLRRDRVRLAVTHTPEAAVALRGFMRRAGGLPPYEFFVFSEDAALRAALLRESRELSSLPIP